MRAWPWIVVVVVLVLFTSLAAAQVAPRTPSPDEMERANRAAALLLGERLAQDRPEDARLIRGSPARVVVVRGQYDHVERVLRSVGVPFHLHDPGGLDRADLRACRLLVLDCPGEIMRNEIGLVRRFVEEGGHLLTTDWAADRVLEPIFPGMVRYNGRPTGDEVVRIRVRQPRHPYLRDVMRPGHAPVWWLENRSHPVTVLDRRRVSVLVESPEMRRRHGEGAIVLVFPWRRGRIVHLVSHLYLQRSVATDSWSRRPAEAFAKDLGFGDGSPAVRRLREAGLAKGVRTGEVYSAYSAQQFLLNVVLEALRPAGPIVPPPLPPPPPPPPVRDGPRAAVSKDALLRDDPDGTPVLAVSSGLRVAILVRRGAWVRVRTPAGQEGWLRGDEIGD